MTTFWRKGFYRASPYGGDHWVEGHWVNREDWNRSSFGSYQDKTPFVRALQESGVLNSVLASSSTARFINPNAECPVCGDRVFFYQNRFGSRVFFDELGPPWPKHPCTDLSANREFRDEDNYDEVSPESRDDSDAEYVDDCLSALNRDLDDEFRLLYGMAAWKFVQVLKRIKGPENVYLVLKASCGDTARHVYVCCYSLPKWLTADFVVLLGKEEICYFDINAMEPQYVPIRRIATAKAFIEELAPLDSARDE